MFRHTATPLLETSASRRAHQSTKSRQALTRALGVELRARASRTARMPSIEAKPPSRSGTPRAAVRSRPCAPRTSRRRAGSRPRRLAERAEHRRAGRRTWRAEAGVERGSRRRRGSSGRRSARPRRRARTSGRRGRLDVRDVVPAPVMSSSSLRMVECSTPTLRDALAPLRVDLDAERDPLQEDRAERADAGRAEVDLGAGVLEVAVADAGLAVDRVADRRGQRSVAEISHRSSPSNATQLLEPDRADRRVGDARTQRLGSPPRRPCRGAATIGSSDVAPPNCRRQRDVKREARDEPSARAAGRVGMPVIFSPFSFARRRARSRTGVPPAMPHENGAVDGTSTPAGRRETAARARDCGAPCAPLGRSMTSLARRPGRSRSR